MVNEDVDAIEVTLKRKKVEAQNCWPPLVVRAQLTTQVALSAVDARLALAKIAQGRITRTGQLNTRAMTGSCCFIDKMKVFIITFSLSQPPRVEMVAL